MSQFPSVDMNVSNFVEFLHMAGVNFKILHCLIFLFNKKHMSKLNTSTIKMNSDLNSNQRRLLQLTIWIFIECSFANFKATSHQIFLAKNIILYRARS
jgi:hypothetical protein